jgi:hypothetical protein
MIKVAFTLIFLMTCFLSRAQSLSSKVDSLTKSHLILTEQKHRTHFNRLLSLREEKKLFGRLDSINFDVVLVEENYCLKDSSVNITERYFSYSDTGFINEKSEADSAVLPFLMYDMGISQDVLSHYYSSSTAGMHHYDFLDHYYSLPVILENYSSLMPVQELMYDTTQPWLGFESQSQFNIAKKEIENKAIQKLKQTYQIVTLIDKRSGKTLVSVQLPAKNPKLELRWVYVSHDW